MHVPRERRVEAWLVASQADLDVACTVRESAAHIACFHAQQAAEKSLKALLTHWSGDAPQVHAMPTLIRALGALDVPVPAEICDHAESLDKYYLPTRYPDALGFADASLAYKPRDADLAIESGTAVVAWVRATLLTRAFDDTP